MAIAVVIAATVAVLVIVSSTLSGPDRVDVAVANPTDYEVNVQVRGVDGDSVHDLGPIPADGTREFTGVVDQGETWRFEFSYAGVTAAELTVPRSELEAGPVVVPATAAEVLEQAGIAPPPR